MRNLIGKRFGRLVVTGNAERGKFYELRCFCLCDCGNEKNVARCHLLGGDVKSCGCLLKDFKKTHGMSYRRVYTTWEQMMGRDKNKNSKRYKDYGGRGIKVCKQWHKFENFYRDMGPRPVGKTIERIDNNGNYEPGNCKWATPKEQQRNTRRNRLIEWGGEIKCVAEWAEEFKINYSTLHKRISRGWSVDRALNG